MMMVMVMMLVMKVLMMVLVVLMVLMVLMVVMMMPMLTMQDGFCARGRPARACFAGISVRFKPHRKLRLLVQVPSAPRRLAGRRKRASNGARGNIPFRLYAARGVPVANPEGCSASRRVAP